MEIPIQKPQRERDEKLLPLHHETFGLRPRDYETFGQNNRHRPKYPVHRFIGSIRGSAVESAFTNLAVIQRNEKGKL